MRIPPSMVLGWALVLTTQAPGGSPGDAPEKPADNPLRLPIAGGSSRPNPADPYILGADISWVQQKEDEGIRYSDRGIPKDMFAILKDHDFNWIRLRIFNDPKASRGYSKKGYCDLAHTLDMAKRIKGAGMKFLLDFHYSDNWADPGKQVKPAAWKDLHGAGLQKAVREYTRDVVARLKAQGTSPDMVQIGNEVSAGLLRPDGAIDKSWDGYCGLLKAGISGAKEADPSMKTMLHFACGGQNARSRQILDQVLAHEVAFDILGQSYYPRWHGTLDDLRSNLTDLATRYKKPIIVVEYTTPNVRKINDIVRNLPDGKGLGTFIWEPTNWGINNGGLFDAKGHTTPEIDVYSEMAKDYAGADG